MAIIYTYPQTSSLENNDLFILSKMDSEDRETRSITAEALGQFLAPFVQGQFLPLVAGPTNPLTGDLYLNPTSSSSSSGSNSIVLKGVDDTGAEIVAAKIFTTDSSINPSGQDLNIQVALDDASLGTQVFVDAFGFVGLGTLTPQANLDVGTDVNVGTNLRVGTSIGVNMGNSANHEIDVAGNIRVEGDNAPGGSGNTGTYWLGGTASGDMNFGISSEGASTSTKKFYIGKAFNGITPYLTMWRTTGSPAGVEGRLQLDAYGVGNFTTGSGGLGAATYNLSVDADGNIIETATGGGGGGLSGGGSGNQFGGDVAFFDGATNIVGDATTPFFYTTGTQSGVTGRLGLGTNSPNFKMDIAGGDLRMEDNFGIRFGGSGSSGQNWNIRTTGDPFGGNYPGTFMIGRGGGSNDPYLQVTTGSFSANNPGQITFNKYGSGNFTGTSAYNLSVDSSGNIIETSGSALPYKLLSQKISQTGTNDPTVDNTFFNDTGSTFTWTRSGTGVYRISANQPTFTTGKTQVFLNIGNIQVNQDPIFISHGIQSTTLIEINTFKLNGTRADVDLQFASFAVHIYP